MILKHLLAKRDFAISHHVPWKHFPFCLSLLWTTLLKANGIDQWFLSFHLHVDPPRSEVGMTPGKCRFLGPTLGSFGLNKLRLKSTLEVTGEFLTHPPSRPSKETEAQSRAESAPILTTGILTSSLLNQIFITRFVR